MNKPSKIKAYVTGIGIVSPLGEDIKTYWSNLISGKSGISITCIYIRIIEISLRAEGRRSVKRHIITPKLMYISFKCRSQGRDFSDSGMQVFISRERAFCDFKKSRKFNNMHIYTYY